MPEPIKEMSYYGGGNFAYKERVYKEMDDAKSMIPKLYVIYSESKCKNTNMEYQALYYLKKLTELLNENLSWLPAYKCKEYQSFIKEYDQKLKNSTKPIEIELGLSDMEYTGPENSRNTERERSARPLLPRANTFQYTMAEHVNIRCKYHCSVYIPNKYSSLCFSSSSHSIVYIPKVVTREINVKNCINITFIASCQQLRLYNIKNSKFFIGKECNSIVLERCENVGFGRYPFQSDHVLEISDVEVPNASESTSFYLIPNEKIPVGIIVMNDNITLEYNEQTI